MLGTKFYCFYDFWFLIKICSEFLRKNFGTVVKKQHFTSRDDHTKNEQISRIMQKFWIFLGIRASNLRSLMGKLHARFSKLHSTCTKEQFEKNLLLGKKVYCFISFEFQSKYVRSFCRKISARCSKLHFTSTVDHSKKEQISRIKQKFWIFLGIRAPKLRRLVKTSCTVVKTAFYMYEGTIQEKFDVGEKSLLFLSLLILNQSIFGVFAKKYGTVVKTAFHVYRWSCRERRTNRLKNTYLFTIFWEFERQIYGDLWKLHARL